MSSLKLMLPYHWCPVYFKICHSIQVCSGIQIHSTNAFMNELITCSKKQLFKMMGMFHHEFCCDNRGKCTEYEICAKLHSQVSCFVYSLALGIFMSAYIFFYPNCIWHNFSTEIFQTAILFSASNECPQHVMPNRP